MNNIYTILHTILYTYTKLILNIYIPFLIVFLSDFINTKKNIKNSISCTYEIKYINIIDSEKSYGELIYIIYNNILIISLYNFFTFKPTLKHIFIISKKIIKSILLSYIGLSILSYNIIKYIILKKNKPLKLFIISLVYKTSCNLKIYKINNILYFNPLSLASINHILNLPKGQRDLLIKKLINYHNSSSLNEIHQLESIKIDKVPKYHYSIKNIFTSNEYKPYMTDYPKAINKNFYNIKPAITKFKYNKDSTILKTETCRIEDTIETHKYVETKSLIQSFKDGYDENIIKPVYINNYKDALEIVNIINFGSPQHIINNDEIA